MPAVTNEGRTLAYARLQGTGRSAIDALLTQSSVTIGRRGGGADCELKSASRSISRIHARLAFRPAQASDDDGYWEISALCPKVGLLVDGVPVLHGMPPHRLVSRALIELNGEVSLYFLGPRRPWVYAEGGDLEKENDLAREKRKRMMGRRRRNVSSKSSARRRKHGRSEEEETDDDELDLDGYDDVDVTPPIHSSKKRKAPDSGQNTKRPRKKAAKEESKASRALRLAEERKSKADLRAHKKALKTAESKARRQNVWTKKDRTDFLRALFTIGVKSEKVSQPNDNGEETSKTVYDWSEFRSHARDLSNKTDDALTVHYEKLAVDCDKVLDKAARLKKILGVRRTSHKDDCICAVCKKKRTKREADARKAEAMGVELPPVAAQETGEPANPPDLAMASDGEGEFLVSLVTAQKLRVRTGIIDAARNVDTEPGVRAISKLSRYYSRDVAGGELPIWWKTGSDDRALLRGVAKHGVGNWDAIWKDLDSEFSYDGDGGGRHGFPIPRVSMKRLREAASTVQAEIRRERKHGGGKAVARISTKSRAPSRPSSNRTSKAGVGEADSDAEEDVGEDYGYDDGVDESEVDGSEDELGETAETGLQNEEGDEGMDAVERNHDDDEDDEDDDEEVDEEGDVDEDDSDTDESGESADEDDDESEEGHEVQDEAGVNHASAPSLPKPSSEASDSDSDSDDAVEMESDSD